MIRRRAIEFRNANWRKECGRPHSHYQTLIGSPLRRQVRIPRYPVSVRSFVNCDQSRPNVVEIQSKLIAVQRNGTKERVPFFRIERFRRAPGVFGSSEFHFEKPHCSVLVASDDVDFRRPCSPIAFDDGKSCPLEMGASQVFSKFSNFRPEVFTLFRHGGIRECAKR